MSAGLPLCSVLPEGRGMLFVMEEEEEEVPIVGRLDERLNALLCVMDHLVYVPDRASGYY